MPRTKNSRNPLGTIITRKIKKHGKVVTVWDVRKRYPKLNEFGNEMFTDSGKKIYQDKTQRCYTKAEAVIALGNMPAEIEAEQAKNTSENITFGQLCDYFKTEYIKKPVYANGVKVAGYKQSLDTLRSDTEEFCTYFGRDLPLSNISYERLRKFTEYLKTKPNRFKKLPAAASVNKKLTLLRFILNVAVQAEWLIVNPFRRGKKLIDRSAEIVRNRMLTFEEERRLIAACTTDAIKVIVWNGREVDMTIPNSKRRAHLVPIIICALDTAMRKSEIFNLAWWQIDFKKKVIYLTEEAAIETKTGVGGVLPLTKRLENIFIEILESHGRSGIENKDKVFVPFKYDRAFSSACADAGIENLQFRDLRSTAATRMMLAGNVGELVRKVTRHTQVETFHEHYTNVDATNARIIGESLQLLIEQENAKLSKDQDVKGDVKGESRSSTKAA